MRKPDHPGHWRLLNAERIEAIPARLARARANADARALAAADWLIRHKGDGRYLATRRGDILTTLFRHALSRSLDADLGELASSAENPAALRPLAGLRGHLDALALDAEAYATKTGFEMIAEPCSLAFAGYDRYRRPLWLTDATAMAWRAMQQAAARVEVELEAVSGYRSHAYQLGIFQRKRAHGLSMADILAVNAAPGFSEHHSGRALDIGCPGQPPTEESFESTAAFAWLQQHAQAFGFHLSYPRDNPHGIVYEPWHWCFHA